MKDIREHPSRALGFLSRYHDGDLTPEEKRDFERHTRACPECRESAEEYEAVLAMYREAGSSEADASLAARISRRIDTELRHRAPVRYVTLQIDLLWASVVAVGLVGVLALYGVFGRRKASPGPTIVAEKAAQAPPAAAPEPAGEENREAGPSPAPPRALRSPSRFSPEAPAPAGEPPAVLPASPPASAPAPESVSGGIAAAPAPASKAEASDSNAAAASRQRDAEAEPLRVGGPVTAPVLIRRVEPIIPESTRRRSIDASPVVVEAVITETGEVARLKVVRSNPPFDAAVIRAVSQWRYRPALLDGKPVSVYLTVTLSIDVH